MGKLLNNSDLVMRTGKLAFYKCRGESIWRRMEGFTELTNAKGTKEYTRQYIDEDFERTDVSGYSPEKSYAFDRYKNNAVLDDIIYITENELIGQAMVREILVLDMTTATTSGGHTGGGDTEYWSAEGKLRHWAVVPDTDGDNNDCMTYSGTFKCRGEMTNVVAISNDDWQTVNEVFETTQSLTPLMDIQIIDDDGTTIAEKKCNTTSTTINANNTTNYTKIKAGATITGATFTLLAENGVVLSSGTATLDYSFAINTIGQTLKHTLLCTFRGNTTSVVINITRVEDTSATSLQNESEE